MRIDQNQRRALQARPRRTGVVLVVLCVVMVAMIAICSMAVDFGRVQTAKTELEDVAESAARVAALNLSSGVSAAQNAAYNAAVANTVDGTAVTLDKINDVIFLNWPSTTPLTGNARSSANAIQVNCYRNATHGGPINLIFAQAIGMSGCDITASSTAKVTSAASTYQIVGLNGFNINGSNTFDSYNSSLGPYSSQTPTSQGSIASNSNYNINSGATIHGNLYYSGSAPTGGTVTGSRIALASALSYTQATTPSGLQGSANDLGNVNLNSGTLTLAAGSYYCSNFSVAGGTVNMTGGPVILYCNGSFNVNSGSIVTYNNIPSNFQLNMVCSAGVDLSTGNLYAEVFAPNSPMNLNNAAAVYGSAIMGQIGTSGTCAIHFDTALGGNGAGSGTPTVSTVK